MLGVIWVASLLVVCAMLMTWPFWPHHPLHSLKICENFARDHGLRFNAAKTQLIRFSKLPSPTYNEVFHFCGTHFPRK